MRDLTRRSNGRSRRFNGMWNILWRIRVYLVLAAAIGFVLFYTFSRASPWDSTRNLIKWRSGPRSFTATPDDIAMDHDVLRHLALQPTFEYRRKCFVAKQRWGLERQSLVDVEHPFLVDPSLASLEEDAGRTARILPPCVDTTDIEVPRFDTDTNVDTGMLLLGMATTLPRLKNSLPEISRWLSRTQARLVVLLVDHPTQEEVTPVQYRAVALQMNLIFEPYQGATNDSEGLRNFALADVLYKHASPKTQWFGLIDDDTFFVSLPRMVTALTPYDPEKSWYIGALTEGLFRVAKEGFKAWGGAGIFISLPLMKLLSANAHSCRSLDGGFGDLLWRDCILEITSPTVKLTQLPGLNQIDLWGDISGFYESGLNPLLTVHHWKSWHFHPIPMAHLVVDVAGPDSFLQRYHFQNNTVLTNGFSIVEYPNGLPDLQLAELTLVEEVEYTRPPDRLEFHNSLGRTRPPLKLGKDKLSWKFEGSVRAADGTIRQFYIKRAQEATGEFDSVIEIDWQKG